MTDLVILYVAAALTGLWGISHLVPTSSVVNDFGTISADNRRIITMEWITEGVALVFNGLLVACVAYVDPTSTVSKVVLGLAAGQLIVLAVVSLFSGFRVNFLPFKLCPVIFATSALLVVIGGLI